MTHEDVRRLLEQVPALRQPSDLDLLTFFIRHPRSLLTSDQLALLLGYELALVAESLETLLEAKLLTRTQHRSHAARLYVLSASGTSEAWLPLLLRLASTREGRLALLAQLPGRPSHESDPHRSSVLTQRRGRPSRPVLVKDASTASPDTRAG